MGDTDLTADAGKSSASRQTFVSGNAARAAGRGPAPAAARAARLRRRATTSVALALDGDRLVGRRGGEERALDLRALRASRDAADAATCRIGDLFVGSGHFNPPTVPLDADGQGVPYATYGFAAQIAEVEVDVELGTVSCSTSTPRTTSAAPSTRRRSKARSTAASRRASAWR